MEGVGALVFGEGSGLHLSSTQGLARSLYAQRAKLDEALTLFEDALERTRAGGGAPREVGALETRLLLVRLARGDDGAREALLQLRPRLLDDDFEDLTRAVDEALEAAHGSQR
ncbi:hypothetical protein Pla163_37220 [Planctomycetes bacterium Pla163]|uniref:Tetratricopeptide repeat protein n=1 Tax=Rohdeia mirabilis TaxID=2528008 RepID=A0A518D521_9BACT|nr:hypothetical protein Pla163_37220 [Planctomycetes bacterium Pla163]